MSKLQLQPRTFPARIAELGFTTELPADWISHELPADEPDFSDSTTFVPLAIVTAPHAAIIFAFVARPAYDDGTLTDWSLYLLNHNRLKPRAMGPGKLGGIPALVGEATQDSDMGPMVMRFAFFEDGGRLVNITLAAPELLADAVVDAWKAMLKSFRLEQPRGSRFADQSIPAPAIMPETELAPEKTEEVPQEVAKESQPAADEQAATPEAPVGFAVHAVAADAATLDPEHPINVNLRERGIGLTPNVVATNDAQRRASIAAGAIEAQMDVPYGWHVIDDGKRTLVLDPGGKIQINLDLIPREGRSTEELLDSIEAQMRQDYPNPEFVRMKQDQIHALGARNIFDGAQPLEQYHLLVAGREQRMLLRARVTATPETAGNACNLAELILNSVVFDCFQQRDEPKPVATKRAESAASGGPKEAAPEGPQWWKDALGFELEGDLKRAEEAISSGCPHMGFAISTAELYRQRMRRLKSAGDEQGALEAFRKASQWSFFYASQATSGGEGAALSLERDSFRAELVAEYGSDPER